MYISRMYKLQGNLINCLELLIFTEVSSRYLKEVKKICLICLLQLLN